MQARMHILQCGSKRTKLYLLRPRRGPPEPLKDLSPVMFFAVETNSDFPARMITQPASNNLSETLLQGGPRLLIVPHGHPALQLDTIDISRWLPTTVGVDFQKALLCQL